MAPINVLEYSLEAKNKVSTLTLSMNVSSELSTKKRPIALMTDAEAPDVLPVTENVCDTPRSI